MITLTHVYGLAGLFFAAISILSARDAANPRRAINTLFWALMAVSFLFGGQIGDLGNGLIAMALVVLGAMGLSKGSAALPPGETLLAQARRHGNLLFLPALIIPTTALAGTLLVRQTAWAENWIDPSQATLICLAIGALIAVGVLMVWLRPRRWRRLRRRDDFLRPSDGRPSCHRCWRPLAQSFSPQASARMSAGSPLSGSPLRPGQPQWPPTASAWRCSPS